jgi:hypothetical protein
MQVAIFFRLVTEGVELFHISKDKTGPCTYNAVYIKYSNSVAVSSGFRGNGCIAIIDIESRKVVKTFLLGTNILWKIGVLDDVVHQGR